MKDIDIAALSAQAMDTITKEHLKLVRHFDFDELASLVSPINKAHSIFLVGMGRTGLMMKAAAMRLMHLGFTAYVVGETTTPAIGEGDLLIAGSGSGTTASVIRSANTAIEKKATLICFTTDATSALAEIANFKVIIPAAQKKEHNSKVSEQYAGSLFEQ
ncbi:MAG: 6-phospho-3-hexuloisomerase, partial [Leeuwenhoekiella sp.]